MAFEKGHKKMGGRKEGTPNKSSFAEFQKEFLKDANKLVPVLNEDGTPKLNKAGKPMKTKQGSIYQYFFEMARKEPSVLIALMRKWMPDLKQVEALLMNIGDDTEEAEEIRKRFIKKFIRVEEEESDTNN